MPTTRQNKFSRLIQKELSELFNREGSVIYGAGIMVTITDVMVSPDLSHAKVFLSIFPPVERKKPMEKIKANSKEIRRKLGNKIREQVRHIPDLDFILDESLDYAENIDKLLKNIKNPPSSEE